MNTIYYRTETEVVTRNQEVSANDCTSLAFINNGTLPLTVNAIPVAAGGQFTVSAPSIAGAKLYGAWNLRFDETDAAPSCSIIKQLEVCR